MIINHYSGLLSWHCYHPLETFPDGVNFCMLGDTTQHGDTRCWGLHRAIHFYPVMLHTLNRWVMGDETPFQRSWVISVTPYTQSRPIWCPFLHSQRCKSWWRFLVLRVMQHAGQTVAIWEQRIFYMGPRWMMEHHYSTLGPWQWRLTPKANRDEADLCMVGDASHDGNTRCWGSCRAIHQYLVVQHTMYESQMDDIGPLQ